MDRIVTNPARAVGGRSRGGLPAALAGFAALPALAAFVVSGLALAPAAHAQGSRPEVAVIDPGTVQLTALGGIQFGGSLDLEGAKLELDSAPTWTAQLGWRAQEDGFVYASYTQQRTRATTSFSNGDPDETFDVTVGYLLFGGELDLRVRKHLVPFIGLGLGATHFTPRDASGGTDWFFAYTAIGGLKIPIVKHVGLRTQVRLLGTVVNSDASWFCASVGGSGTCAVRLDDTTNVIQGDVTAGLYVSF